MLKVLQNMHQSYTQLIREGQNVGQKQLVTTWRNSAKEATSGQYFERKVLPNGNIKTRMLTVCAGNAMPIGLETKVVTPNNNLVYKTIGILKNNTSHLAKNVRDLKTKLANGTINKWEMQKLEQCELAKKQNTKMYASNSNMSFIKDCLYSDKKGAKTLMGSTYGIY